MKVMKYLVLKLLSVDNHVRWFINFSRWIACCIPFLGPLLSLFLDRLLLILYGVDATSRTVNVKYLSISHPAGVLLGGNGIYSEGRVVIMSGVKLGGKNPKCEKYLSKHKEMRVFEFGDNVVIGSNSVVLGPVTICDNVIVGAMSLVNRSISEPGVYVGNPVKKVSDITNLDWVSHISF